MKDKPYEALNLSIEGHSLIITGQCRTGKTLTLRQLHVVDLTLFKWSIITIRPTYWLAFLLELLLNHHFWSGGQH